MKESNQERFQKLLSARVYNSCASGDLEQLISLVKMGADVNRKDDNIGVTPLYIACQRGSLEMAQFFLSKNAQVTF